LDQVIAYFDERSVIITTLSIDERGELSLDRFHYNS
jgi:hypothetical protein